MKDLPLAASEMRVTGSLLTGASLKMSIRDALKEMNSHQHIYWRGQEEYVQGSRVSNLTFWRCCRLSDDRSLNPSPWNGRGPIKAQAQQAYSAHKESGESCMFLQPFLKQT